MASSRTAAAACSGNLHTTEGSASMHLAAG
eukprot:COSAG01_NODE_33967_length_555_cov_3.543860_1_plen_29_part_01